MIRLLILLASPLLISSCASIMSAASGKLADDLTAGILNQTDVQLVRDGTPAYLIMLDGLISGSPDNTTLLVAGARLYSSYATTLVEDNDRAKSLAEKGKKYGTRAICLRNKGICDSYGKPYDEFIPHLQRIQKKDIPELYAFASSWAAWVQTHSDDWNAIADIPKIEAMMQHVVVIDEQYDNGSAHIYLGVLSTQLPAELGGKPERGKAHFERALEITEEKNMMVKVLYAKYYARLVFDKELHDRLLTDVLNSNPDVSGFALINTMAQQQAKELLSTSDEYF